jgi:hypothetical protein
MKKRRLTKKDLKDLQEQVFQYEVTLTKIVPREIAHQNDTLTEEIDILLFQRDSLEKEFQQYGTEGIIAPIWQRVQELDKVLVEQRWMILDHARDYYEQTRERLKTPPEYWWWYLDDLESAKLPEWVMAGSRRG